MTSLSYVLAALTPSLAKPAALLTRAALIFAAFSVLQGCNAQQPWPLWEAYTQHFLDDQGRVVDHSDHDRTTSEGQAYAMFFALVDNDKPHFDKLLKWTEANLAGGDLTLRLPAWRWGKTDSGEWRTIDDNPASDADLWLAYTLIQAGRLWHDPRYDTLGRLIAKRIEREEVVLISGIGTTIAPGPHGFQTGADTYILNPSYLPLPVLVNLAKTLPQGPWTGVLESLPQLISGQMAGGFAMDWVAAGPAGVHPSGPPVEPISGAQVHEPAGSYDAIRVYLWLGLADAATPGERDLLSLTNGMGTYLRDAQTPPLEVDGQGKVLRADPPIGFSAAVVPYLRAQGMKAQAQAQQDRLTAAREPGTGLYGKPGEYYDENLVLFSTGFIEQRYRFELDGSLRVKWK